jgi:hypothetical protein
MLICEHEHNNLGSKKVCLVFVPYEVGPFSNALSVLITHVIKLWINPLINPPGRLLIVNVGDVMCIWVRDKDIINPLRREDRTIKQNISLTCRNF